jgi:hypothetical protein
MPLDAFVDRKILENGQEYIKDSMAAAFQAQWTNKTVGFATLLGMMDKGLQLFLPTYANRQICTNAEGDSTSLVMGTNGNTPPQCVYWKRQMAAVWECLNDGTCDETSHGSHGNAYPTLQACKQECGSAKWMCLQSKDQGAGFAGAKGKMCVQQEAGACPSPLRRRRRART